LAIGIVALPQPMCHGKGITFKKAHGCEICDFASKNPEYNNIFTDAMACTNKIVMATVLAEQKDGFGYVGSLVDVRGRMGGMITNIVKSHSHIKGINFDLPHILFP
jgi:hypothetical protein